MDTAEKSGVMKGLRWSDWSESEIEQISEGDEDIGKLMSLYQLLVDSEWDKMN